MSFNKITIVGNLGKDPDLRYTPDGTAVCNFNLATNHKGKDGNFEATWFKVTLWKNRALAAAQYLQKGSSVYIEGRLSIEKWTDRDGVQQFSLGVQASDMQFIGSRDADRPEEAAPVATHTGSPAEPKRSVMVGDDDTPF